MRSLLTPRWVLAHIFVLAVGTTCIVLGFWQLGRLEERRTENAVHGARFQEDPRPLDELIEGIGGDVASLEYRRATVTGVYDTSEEVLVRSQVREGRAGFEILTPLETSGGRGVVVNRGWVPLEFDRAPVAAALPPDGTTTVVGVVRLSHARSVASPDPATEANSLSRVDLEILDDMIGLDLYPVYLEVVGSASPTELPVPADPPDFEDEGPHLSYAIQWFSFAAVGAFGYGFLLRRALRGRSADGGGQSLDDLDAGDTG